MAGTEIVSHVEVFAILDEILAAGKEASLSLAQIAKRMGTQVPAIARRANGCAYFYAADDACDRAGCRLIQTIAAGLILKNFAVQSPLF